MKRHCVSRDLAHWAYLPIPFWDGPEPYDKVRRLWLRGCEAATFLGSCSVSLACASLCFVPPSVCALPQPFFQSAIETDALFTQQIDALLREVGDRGNPTLKAKQKQAPQMLQAPVPYSQTGQQEVEGTSR